jgi:hypothetical protein
VGVLVCLLLSDVRRKETRLANNLLELERARKQLLREERPAAVGRFSSAVAHEIRKSGGDDLKLDSHGEAAFGGGARRDV